MQKWIAVWFVCLIFGGCDSDSGNSTTADVAHDESTVADAVGDAINDEAAPDQTTEVFTGNPQIDEALSGYLTALDENTDMLCDCWLGRNYDDKETCVDVQLLAGQFTIAECRLDVYVAYPQEALDFFQCAHAVKGDFIACLPAMCPDDDEERRATYVDCVVANSNNCLELSSTEFQDGLVACDG